MTKRRLLRWSLLLITLAAFAVWLEPTRVVWGWLRGEAFYQGRPTSWWRHRLSNFKVVPIAHIDESGVKEMRNVMVYDRPKRFYDWFASTVLRLDLEADFKAWDLDIVMDGEFQPVLAQLQADADPAVQGKANVFAHVSRHK